jgi:hypothetical protein
LLATVSAAQLGFRFGGMASLAAGRPAVVAVPGAASAAHRSPVARSVRETLHQLTTPSVCGDGRVAAVLG